MPLLCELFAFSVALFVAAAATTDVHITVLPSQQLRGHFTKLKSKTVAQLNADVHRWSERTAPSQPYD